MSAIPSAEVVMERLRMALAEAGYPEVSLKHVGTGEDGEPDIRYPLGIIPAAIAWQAGSIAFGSFPCWACWSESLAVQCWSVAEPCKQGNCSHPEGPARPPRELLRAS